MNSSEKHHILDFCEKLGPYLKRKYNRFEVTMLVQERVTISLHMLGSSNGLQGIGNLYGVHKNTLSELLRNFFRVVRKHLQPIFMQTQMNRRLGF